MVSPLVFFLLAVAVVAQETPTNTTLGPQKSERELRKDLFFDYDKYARPVKKQSRTVPVKISMALASVRSLDLETQMIILDSWIKLTWIDEYLTWNPSEYDNITVLHISPSQVWRPDIALYTASPDTALFPTVFTQVLIYSNGTLLWVPPFTIYSRCPTELNTCAKHVTCVMKMGSWTYSEKELDLRLDTDELNLEYFDDENRQWTLFNSVSSRESKLYSCCPDAYPFVSFNITMKKRNWMDN